MRRFVPAGPRALLGLDGRYIDGEAVLHMRLEQSDMRFNYPIEQSGLRQSSQPLEFLMYERLHLLHALPIDAKIAIAGTRG